MAVSRIQVTLPCELNKVWEAVTSLTVYGWRSDLSKIEVLSDTRFVEYTKDGYATTFTTTALEPYQRWEFDLENGNITGHWIGLFAEMDGHTQLELTETITAKKFFMRPFVKAYLKKQQARYIADLKRALEMERGNANGTQES